MKRVHIAGLGIIVGAAVLWLSSRLAWVTVHAFDDKAGESVETIHGAAWATEITAISLLVLAGGAVSFVLRRWGRRIVGGVCGLAAALISWLPLSLLVQGADPNRAHDLLTSGVTTQRSTDPVSLSEWADISAIDTHTGALIVALAGCVVALFSGIVLATDPGEDSKRKVSRYERNASRLAEVEENLEEHPDSARVMWDALDADIDPTDRESERSTTPKD